MRLNDETLGALILARTGQGAVQGLGVCVAYSEQPMLLLRLTDGSTFWWQAGLCEALELPADAAREIKALIEKQGARGVVKGEGDNR